ncbi:MAG: RDD family protein [Planctomycetes bacterium]|nr:RDD family protein [Planctomycetota bacterium]MCP4771677.1 RDD family protein [Planctomycetota bacterium]MCP4860023.1 RDD family protein [Planctomycetota bacterium]
MTTLWFYAQDQQQHGPVPADEMRKLLQSGRLSKTTMVWSEGMESWVAAGKVEELVGLAPPIRPPAVEPNHRTQPVVEVDAGGAEQSPFQSRPQPGPRPTQASGGSQVQLRSRHAWHRFFARSIDVFAGGWIVSQFLGPEAANSSINFLLPGLVLLILIPIEAWFLSRWGMTPGKWILRIRVVHAENRLLTFQEASQRNLKVIFSGMAFGLPLLQVLFNVLAYKEFVDTGSTSWDRKCRTTLQHAPMRPIHIGTAIGVGIAIILYTAAVVGAST